MGLTKINDSTQLAPSTNIALVHLRCFQLLFESLEPFSGRAVIHEITDSPRKLTRELIICL